MMFEVIEEPRKLKCIIAGSRTITDYDFLEFGIKLCPFKDQIIEIVSGHANGVDKLGERWAQENNIPIKQFIPDWDTLGKRAGYVRNAQMAEYADAAIILWDGSSRGTKHMIDLARENNLLVYVMDIK